MPQPLDIFDVSEKIVLVTGGRRGLGRAIAEQFAKAGATVGVAASSSNAGDLANAMKRTGARWRYFQADLSDRIARKKLMDDAVEAFGRINVLVNCAGIQHRQPAIDFKLEKWDEIISLMLTGVFELAQYAARAMEKQGGGKIINIASLNSFQGGLTIPAYAAAKHGVLGLTRALANEWAAKNINVNAVAPGYFDTDMCAGIKNDPVREPQIRARIPAGRWGKPEELTGAVLFLASEASAYIHGQTIVVDGGWLGR